MKYYCILFVSFFVTVALAAQVKPSQQWLDRKYSMFIHFGLYSAYGGVYEGKPVTRGYSEQIRAFAGIFSDRYGNTAVMHNTGVKSEYCSCVRKTDAQEKSTINCIFAT